MTTTWKRASLVVPSLFAAWVIHAAHRHHDTDEVIRFGAPVLVMLWIVMAGLVIMRARESAPGTARAGAFDVLTATGRSTMWAGAAAIGAAALTGWASLSVVGVLGLGTTYLAVIWTLLACGPRMWAGATITRAILPEAATEGDPMREEIRVRGLGIPAGMRWFATGRATAHSVVTRYAVGSDGSRADVSLESALGPISRGDYRAAPLAMWFGDVLGLARTPIVHREEASFTVLPRPTPVDGVRALLGLGGDAATTVHTVKMPTEGTFRIREYAPGDDMRRIHWVRSLQANELVVRLPDEVPPAEPSVRLVLDNWLPGADLLTCRGHQQMLDALVRVWLGVGRAIAETGTRVTLVAAVDKPADSDGIRVVAKVERPMLARVSREALRLGARIAWQGQVPLAQLLAPRRGDEAKRIVVSARPHKVGADDITRVVLPEGAWTQPEPWPISPQVALLPYPIGSGDNRFERLRTDRQRYLTGWADRAVFCEMVSWLGADKRGAFVAMQTRGGVSLQVLP